MKTAATKLVLVSCCAPCSCGAIKQLYDAMHTDNGRIISAPTSAIRNQLSEISDFIVLFYNPNIYPDTEYQKRLNEQIKYCESLGVKYAIGNYDHDAWLSAVHGMESEPERGRRCFACFKYRFRFAQEFAIEHGYNAIASVLGVSKHKDQGQVDAAAIQVLNETNSHRHWRGVARESVTGGGYTHSDRFTKSALAHSKTLKRNMTDAERLLWYYLRGRKDFSFRKQQAIGNYIADFVCVSQKLIIELDGAQHGDEKHIAHDTIRDTFLKDSGYRVLRFWNAEIFKNMDTVLNTIYHYLATSNHPPSRFRVLPPASGGGHSTGQKEPDASGIIPTAIGGGCAGLSARGVAKIQYIPIKWDDSLKQEIGKNAGFYRQNYCGCEFSIRKV